MNTNEIIFLDFETGSRNPHTTQPIQLAAVAIDGRKLEVIDEFCTDILPIVDEKECEKLGIDTLQGEALKVNKKKVEDLLKAPCGKVVWNNFSTFVNKYNAKGNNYSAPIMAGANIYGFDNIIIDRMAAQFGSYEATERRCTLFNKIHKYDLLHDFFRWFENVHGVKSMSMDSMRDLLGIDKTNAHDALQDVRDGAKILIRFMKLYRQVFKTVRFRPKNSTVVTVEKELEVVNAKVFPDE